MIRVMLILMEKEEMTSDIYRFVNHRYQLNLSIVYFLDGMHRIEQTRSILRVSSDVTKRALLNLGQKRQK